MEIVKGGGKQFGKPEKSPLYKGSLCRRRNKPVNFFDRAFVNEKQSGNKNIIKINIFGCLSQNAISTGVA